MTKTKYTKLEQETKPLQVPLCTQSPLNVFEKLGDYTTLYLGAKDGNKYWRLKLDSGKVKMIESVKHSCNDVDVTVVKGTTVLEGTFKGCDANNKFKIVLTDNVTEMAREMKILCYAELYIDGSLLNTLYYLVK